MAALSFAIQKAAFMTSWSALVKNYMTRKLDDKLDSLEKDVSWMLQTVASLKQQSNVTKNAKRKKKDNETGATVSQQSLPVTPGCFESLAVTGATRTVCR